MNKIGSPRKTLSTNLSYQNDKNQAFKVIQEFLINKNLEQKRPQFHDAEISPIDLTIKKNLKKSATTPGYKTPCKTPVKENEDYKFEQKKKSFHKTETNLNLRKSSNTKDNKRENKSWSSSDSSSYTEINVKKDLNQIYNQIPSLSGMNKKESDIKSKPLLYYNYKQCGFKYQDINGSKYGNYFKVNVGAPRNWLKSKFQNRYINESFMITN